MSNCSQFLELLFDYIDDEFTDNVLVISVLNIFLLLKIELNLKKYSGRKQRKNILTDWN